MKRFLATMMALVLLMGCVPVGASAFSTLTCPGCGATLTLLFENEQIKCSNCSYERPGIPSDFAFFIRLDDADGNSTGQWEKANNNQMKFRCKVFNRSPSDFDFMTIKAVEIGMYAKNVWGELVWGEDTYYTGTTTCEIKPGHWHWTDYFVLPDRSEISTLHVFIKRVAYTNGTITETDADHAVEFYWDIKW